MTFFNKYVFILLVFGVAGIGFAPVLAKLAVNLDGGSGEDILSPVSVAFWRMALSIPFFLVMVRKNNKQNESQSVAKGFSPGLLLPGFIFAIDLGLWHWSFEFTSVANSTLEANLSVIIVSCAGWYFFKERFTWLFPVGVAFAIFGMARLVGAGFASEGQQWIGDLLGIATAFAYGSYQLIIKKLSRDYSTVRLMLWSSMISSCFLMLFALLTPGRIMPQTSSAWAAIIALALVSQMFGQALIAFAISRLPVSLTGVTLILQPVLAAVWAWIILHQQMTPIQMVFCLVVVLGIGLAKLGSDPQLFKPGDRIQVDV